jgi:hypothetical protein
MDYHVFILSRIREGHDRGLSTDKAISHGIKTTAGTVTSAAFVMVGVFLVFVTLPLVDLKEMGVGLALAVLIDATLVRGVLLPATMKLLGEANWYLPNWLKLAAAQRARELDRTGRHSRGRLALTLHVNRPRPRSVGRAAVDAVPGKRDLDLGDGLWSRRTRRPRPDPRSEAADPAAESRALSTPTYALVADKLGVGTGPDWLFQRSRLGTIRVTATGRSGKPIFVGIARTSQIDEYLGDVAHDEITDIEVDPFSVVSSRQPGAARPAAPTSQTFWARRASGADRETLTWPVQKGDWAVVVMNADGARGVQTGVSVGAKFGFLLWLGIGLFVVGGLFAVATAAIYRGAGRRPPRSAATSAGYGGPHELGTPRPDRGPG